MQMQNTTLMHDPVTLIFLAIIGLMFLAGLRSLILGLRGKRIDDHPLCGKCRFDLTGLPEDQTKCPECGAVLSQVGTRVGNRKRHPRRIWAGMILMGLSSAMCLPTGLKMMGQMDWFGVMPTWFMRYQIQNDTGWAGRAWSQIYVRYERKQLSQSQLAALIDDALTLQSKVVRPWHIEAGDYIKLTHDRGDIPQLQWDLYKRFIAENAMHMEIRDTLEIGTFFPFKLVKQVRRMGRNELWCERHIALIQIGDVIIKQNQPAGAGTLSNNSGGYTSRGFGLSPKIWDQLKPGKHTVHLEFDCTLFDDGNEHHSDKPDNMSALTCRIKQDIPITLLPKGTSSATPIVDESKLEEVSGAFQIGKLEYNTAKQNWEMEITIAPFSVSLAFDVMIVRNEQTFRIGTITLSANHSTTWAIDQNFPVSIADGQFVDVMLVPSATAASKTVDIKEYWDLPVTIEQVPVKVK